MLEIRVSAHGFHIATDALCRRVASSFSNGETINFVQLRIIDFGPKGILDHFHISA